MVAARMRWQVVVAAIAVAVLAATTGVLSGAADLIVRARTQLALEQLLDDLPDDDLPVARFSALPSARVRGSVRGAASLSLQTNANAARVLGIAAGSPAPDAIAARAAVMVIRHDAEEAVALLEEAVGRASGEARLWSDLSGAYFETSQPLRALVAADKALRIDPRFAPALRNRALILERLGLAPVADQHWQKLHSERGRWGSLQTKLEEAAAAGDDATVARIAGECPAMARAWGEGRYLARWAADPANGAEPLRSARAIGAALQGRGESLLSEAVGAIDDAIAQGDSARLAHLAEAHLAYDAGRMVYAKRDYVVAERDLRQAAASFRVARSPMEHVAQSFIASSVLELMRYDEASRILTDVLAAARQRSGHRSLLAHAESLMAMCNVGRGRWDEAADGAQRAIALYHGLGEAMNAATSEAVLAAILDFVGQRERGWEMRLRAFESTSADGAPNRLLVAAGAATRAAMRARDNDLALSFLDIEVALAPRVRDPLLVADLFTRRALLQHERGAFEDRDRSVARARVAITAVTNRDERARLTIELDATEAIFVRDAGASRAIELLGRAIRFCEDVDRRFMLPSFLLQRGRAHLAAGDRTFAWQDFSQAIEELEAQRGAIAKLDLRSHLLDTAVELFEEALALQVRAGNAEAAFRVAERARARTLLDVLEERPQPVRSSSAIASRLAPDTLLVEYAVLRDELAIFAIRHDGMRMHRVPVPRAGLLTRADLAELLLGPIRDELATARRLIIVPDGELQRLAFGALRWNGRYLAQTHVISEAPSASRLAAAPPETRTGERSILIVGNPVSDAARDLDALPRVRREIAEIRAIHRPSSVLFGPDATKARFQAEAANHDGIHFAGHGLSDEQSVTASLMLHDAALTVADIAALRLPRKPLVVLSACGTLRGRIAGVDGMSSLARAFLIAGASAVVGTLTEIDDDQAAPLVTSFHRRIAEGAHPAEALRDAQLEAIARGGAAADPKNWAQFVLYSATP